MDYALNDEQNMLVETSLALGGEFGPDYWREKDDGGEYPTEFFKAMGKHGFYSLGLPEEHGGTPAGITEIALAMEALCRGGAGGGTCTGLFVWDARSQYYQISRKCGSARRIYA
ncbi:acyl-CoA dehydrogenase family protein [Hellea sp.]|nr:acyl-CoA dehydrogenase family protein [Hellea sp.]